MTGGFSLSPFQLVVSEKVTKKIGEGATKRTTDGMLYYFAEKLESGELFIQTLNADFMPGGDKKKITDDEFLANYKPEPLVYYNQVKPKLDAVEEHIAQGDKARAEEKFKKAERQYEAALKIDPDNVRAVFGLGLTYLQAQNTDNAQEIFEKLMTLEAAFEPGQKHLFNEFGMRLRKAKMLDQALKYYEKAQAVSGDDDHLLFNVGRVLYDMERFDDSLETMRKALEINPELDAAKAMERHILEHYPHLG